MLRLLLDAHVPADVTKPLQGRAVHLRNWQHGRFLQAADPDVLEAALDAGLTIVTFDVHTIPDHLRERAQRGLETPASYL